MIKKGLMAILFGIALTLSSLALGTNLKVPKNMPMSYAPIEVQNSGYASGINCKFPIRWSPRLPQSSYQHVWLQICSEDKRNCGGGFPVTNNGEYYGFKPDISMAGKHWVVKISTSDKKHVGFGPKFFVDGLRPPCK